MPTKKLATHKDLDLAVAVSKPPSHAVMEEADYARTEEDDYNRIVDLTRETDDLRRNVSLLKDELSKAESALRAANNELRDSSDALKKEEDKAASLQSQIERLTSKIEHERAATKDAEGRVQTLYADLDQARFAHRSVLNDRDEALADKRDIELQLEDLKEQWQETEERIEMLQAELEDAQKVADHAADVEHDIARMRDQIQDQERTIMIKDERISHLEMQVQKERQINYHTADAIARSKAASPVDDDRHIGAMAFDSLEAELSAIDDNEFYEVAWNEFSHIEETPLTYEPIAPRVVPRSSLYTQEAGSIEPVAVRAPRLTMDVTEAGSLVPREPEVVECSISVGEGTSTEPVAVVVPTHELVVREGSSTEPVAAIAPTHALIVQESSSTEPVAARVPTHALAIHQGTSTEPVAAAVPTHALVVQDGTSTEPVAATVPTHALAMQESTSTEPMAPTIPTHALVVHEMANTEPIEPARAPLSSIHAYETASFTPKAPMPTQNTFNQHAILDIAPRIPNVAALTVSVREAGSTIPTVRHISTSSSLTQTDAPRLTSEFIHSATVSTTPHVPVKAATAESLIQTDAPVLTSLLVNYATTSTAPVEPFEMIDAPVAKPEVSATFAVDISPVAPKADQRTSATITKGTQTVPESPKSSSSPSSEVGSITTTLEVEPIEQVVAKVEPKRPTSSTGVQASIELPVEETEEPVQATPPALPTNTNTKSSRTTTEWMLRILTTVLALFCLHLYLQLDAWRTANGVGYSNVASRYGAYGNGRHLFGVIPIGMSDSWLSRQISRHMLSALSRLETWAGAEYQPLY